MTTREQQEASWAEVYGRMTADERRVADDIITNRATDNGRQQKQWAEELLSLADIIADSTTTPSWPVVSMFWVRFHGVVTEMLDFNWQQAEWARAMTAKERARSLVRFSLAIYDAGQAMLGELAEDEVVVADYLRQRTVHLKQDAYALRLKKKKDSREVVDKRFISQLGKTFTIKDVDRMRAEVTARYGSGEQFARYVAVKVRPGAQRLVLALRELHGLR
jgi:hypothetical protein